MHEVFLTRGSVRGAPFSTSVHIFTKENVVLVHEGKCHEQAQHTQMGKMLAIQNILSFVSRSDIKEWLDFMSLLLPRDIISQARCILEEP